MEVGTGQSSPGHRVELVYHQVIGASRVGVMKRSLVNVFGSIVTISFLGVGCGDNEPNNPSGDGDGDITTNGDGAGGSGSSGDGDGDAEGNCSDAQTACGDECTNTSSDPKNCGACGTKCGADEGCSDGECQRFGCTTGQVECGGSCVDLQRDPDFCGDCDIACGSGQSCSNGSCVAECPTGELACNGSCIDPATDDQFCGATLCSGEAGMGGSGSLDEGQACGAGEKCETGSCVLDCVPGSIVCDGACVDPLVSRSFCGATSCEDAATSGESCENGEVCAGGTCETSCPGDQLECGGECVDPLKNRDYCGATTCADGESSGEVCDNGEVCVSGVCQTSCPGDQLECDGSCIDADTDELYCGAIVCGDDSTNGDVCDAGERCQGGTCAVSCSAGRIVCNGSCVDPLKDRDFCGATTCQAAGSYGEACENGEVCVSGSCETSCPTDQLECEGMCIDPRTDEAHCGAFACGDDRTDGIACGTSELCVSGVCEVSCGSNLIACESSCIDPLGDPDHCGATDCSSELGMGIACSGDQACVIGECRKFVPAWSLGERVDIIDQHSVYPDQRVAANVSGKAVTIWRQATLDDPNVEVEFASNRIYASIYYPDTKSWSDQVLLSSANIGVRNLSLVVAPDGGAIATWVEGGIGVANRLFGSVLNGANDSWSIPIRIDDGIDDNSIDLPEVEMDSQGNAIVAWSEGSLASAWATTSILARRFDGTSKAFDGTIEVMPRVTGSSGIAYAGTPKLDVSATGFVALSWLEFAVDVQRPSGKNTPVVRRTNIVNTGAPWDLGVDLQAGTAYGNISNLGPSVDVGVDDAGDVYAAYVGDTANSRLVHVDFYNSGTSTWTSHTTDVFGDTAGAQRARYVDLAVRGNGDLWVTFLVENSTGLTENIVFAQAKKAGVWGNYGAISQTSVRAGAAFRPVPSVEIDLQGTAFVSWVRYSDTSAFAEANRYDASLNAWTGVTQLNETALGAGASPSLAVSGGGVAFSSWVQLTTALGNIHLYVARFN